MVNQWIKKLPKKFLKGVIGLNICIFTYGWLKSPIDYRYKLSIGVEVSEDDTRNLLNSKIYPKIKTEMQENTSKIKSTTRLNDIERMQKEKLDVIVIGGGCVGSGVAYAASSRGLKVGLIEKNDFSSGTSSKSTKIAHGGIRYLEEVVKLKNPSEKMALVFEALAERDRILKSGVFINEVVPVNIPASNIFEAYYLYMGTFIYHMFYRASIWPFKGLVPSPSISINSLFMKGFFDLKVKNFNKKVEEYKISKNKNDIKVTHEEKDKNMLNNDENKITLKRIYLWIQKQYLDISEFRKGNNKFKYIITLYEGQMIDSRQNLLTLTSDRVKKTGYLANYVEFDDYLYNEEGKIKGVRCLDKVTGKYFTINAEVICNCTGVHTDLNLGKNTKELLVASKGTHIVVNKSVLEKYVKDKGFMIPKTSDGRILFILPYLGKYLIGTTDQRVPKFEKVKPSENEMKFIIKEVSDFFKIEPKLFSDNCLSCWSGLRPIVIVDPNKEEIDANKFNENDLNGLNKLAIKEVSRKHVVYRDPKTNLYSVMGGKWTTYLKMGEDCVNDILRHNASLETKSKEFLSDSKLNPELLLLQGSLYSENSHTINANEYYKLRSYFKSISDLLSVRFPNIPEPYINTLLKFYGLNAIKILEKGNSENTNYPIFPNLSSIETVYKSELDYCIDNEYVVSPNDFIIRRRSIGIVNSDLALKYIPIVGKYLQLRFNWSDKQFKNEIESAIDGLQYMM